MKYFSVCLYSNQTFLNLSRNILWAISVCFCFCFCFFALSNMSFTVTVSMTSKEHHRMVGVTGGTGKDKVIDDLNQFN